MKKFVLVLLALLLVFATTMLVVACDKQDPCKDGHSYDDGEIVKPASCKEEGELLKRCTKCGATKTEPIAPNDDHEYGELIPVKGATCGEAGVKAHYQCSVCQKLFVDDENGTKQQVTESDLEIAPTGQHDYENQPYVSDGDEGHHQLCKECGTPNATDKHTLTYTKVDDNQHKIECSDCDYEKTTNHVWDAGTMSDPASCEKPGTQTFRCQSGECGATKSVTVPAAGHQGVEQEGKPATCVTDGYSVYYKCSACGKYSLTKDSGYTFDTEDAVKAAGKIAATGKHNYENQPYHSDGDEGHYQLCSVCGQRGDTEQHTLSYTPIEGQQKHTAKCSVCDYEEQKDCVIQNSKCTLCNADYTVKQHVTVHFHLSTGWTASELKVYAWYSENNETVYVTGGWPGNLKLTAESDGWYTCSFEVEKGHVNVDLYIIINDMVETSTNEDGSKNYSGNKTGDILVNANEIWVPGITEQFLGNKAYDSEEKALKAEQDLPKPDVNDWVVAGGGSLGNWGDTIDHLFTHYTDGDKESYNYSLMISLKAGDEFKVKHWGSWDNSLGYGDIYFSKADGITLNQDDFFKDNNGNIKVLRDCTVSLTIYDNNTGTLNIYVHSDSAAQADVQTVLASHAQQAAICAAALNVEYSERSGNGGSCVFKALTTDLFKSAQQMDFVTVAFR